MSQIVTVLGASGNIGKLLVPYLVKKGYKVQAVGRQLPRFKDPNIENLGVNYGDAKALEKVFENSSVVYCLVGLEYKSKVWQKEWPALAHNLVEAISSSKAKLVFFDNVYSYGLVQGKMTENKPLNPETKKGKVRKEVVEILEKAHKEGKINLILAKSADFYGPGITTSVLGDRFFDLMLNKDTLEFFGNPAKLHNYTYIGDIPAALEVLGKSDFEGNIHLPTARALRGEEFKQILDKLTGKDLKIKPMRQSTALILSIFIPILRELYEMMYQSENDYDFDSSKIKQLFPELKTTSYEDGFKETIDWYKSQKSK
jgi:nucleoside-diphosphate-sugar epimerase